MIDSIILLSGVTFEEAIVVIQQYQYLGAILTPLFFGELSFHIFGILNGSGDISLIPFVISLVSVVVFDTVLYSVMRVLKSRYHNFEEVLRKIKIMARFEKVFKKCEERYSKSPALLLTAVKLLPMTKVTILFFSLWTKISFRRFIMWDVVISVVWGVAVFAPGWFVGKELLSQEAGRNVVSFFVYFLALLVVFVLFGDYIDKLVLSITEKIAGKLGVRKKREEGGDIKGGD